MKSSAVRTCNYRRDPDGIKAQVLDVVKLRLQTLEGTATVLPEVAARSASSVATAAGDAVCEYEVDAAGFPCSCICSMDQGGDLEQEGNDGL